MPPLIAAAITAAIPAAGTAVIGTVTYATIAANVIFTAALVGAQVAVAGLMQQKPKASAVSRALKQADRPRFYVGGRFRTGGVYIFEEAYVGTHYGCAVVFCCGPIDAVEIMEIDDRTIDMQLNNPGAPTTVTAETYQWTGEIGIFNRVEFKAEISLGYPAGYGSEYLATRFSSVWTDTDHLAKGLCAFYFVDIKPAASFIARAFPNVFPQLNFTIRGARVYDPREVGHTADDDFDDPATWEWSDNPALILAWYLRHPGSPIRAEVDELDWDSFEAAADFCDANVPGYDGSFEPFARAQLLWDESESAEEVISRLLSAFDGYLEEDNQGRWKVGVRQWVAPRITLGDADISAARIESGSALIYAVNRIEVTFADPSKRYVASPTFRIDDTESQALIGVKSQSMHFECVPSKTQAYRMATRYMRRLKDKRRVQITTGPRGLLAIGERAIAIDAPSFGLTGTFTVEENEGNLAQRKLTLIEVFESDFDDIEIEEDPAESITLLTTPSPAAPTSLTLDHREDNGIAYLRASVAASSDDNVTGVEFEWSDDAGATWVPFITPLGAWAWESEGVAGGDTYDVRGRYVIELGLSSNWATDDITIPSLAPPIPSYFAATGDVGFAYLEAQAPNSTRVAAIQFWRSATGAGFGSASAIGSPVLCAPNAFVDYTDTIAAGTYDYYATAQSGAGEDSTEAGPQSATVT